MKRRIVFVAMLGLGAALGVAHAKDQSPISDFDKCDQACNFERMKCDGSFPKTIPLPWEPAPGPSIPGGPNPNGSPEGCKAIYESCRETCKAKYPSNP